MRNLWTSDNFFAG